MQSLNRPLKENYSEEEAAQMLGMSVARLQKLLDQHIFNDGSGRPSALQLRQSDLVLISFWDRTEPNAKVVRMPRR